MAGSYRIGVDIGGTFTDFTMVDDRTGDVFVEKCLTTPGQPELAVLEGLRRFTALRADTLPNAEAVIHATTLLTNVVLERKGALTGLVTTAGFRDVLEFAREMRYDIYDPFIEFPEPLVERPLRIGVRERVLVNGKVHVPLSEADVRAAAAVFKKAKVQAVAICFLHSYRNPDHERRARDILARELPGVEFSISSEVHPEPKEYERTSTTVVDAYVKPTAAQYLDKLSSDLRADGYPNNLFVMLSNGGTAILAETTEIYGAENLLLERAVSAEVGNRLIGLLEWWEDYTKNEPQGFDNNPSPGNKVGGLTTILEKSLGAVAKGGTTILVEVYGYARRVDKPGLVFMDSPGFDPVSATGQVAGGANLIVFTTGRGSCFGCRPAPSIKLATNTAMFTRMEEDMDINCGTILEGQHSIEAMGRIIFEEMIATASGKPTKSESLGYGDDEFAPWHVNAWL